MANKEEEKMDPLELVLSTINKKFGKGSIFQLSDNNSIAIDRVSTGSILLDRALGGGIPRGRIIEILGNESAGKSTLCLHIVKEAQLQGLKAAYIDAEHALDLSYANKLGVSVQDLLVSQPDSGEQALEIVDLLVRSKAVQLVVVDSVAALVPEKELEGEMGDSNIGLQARLMSQAMRKLAAICNNNKVSVIFTNQIRMKIGVMFGSPETTSGGNSLKFYASQRLEIKRKEILKQEGEDPIGILSRVKVIKNKVSPPLKEAEIEIIFDQGINITKEIFELSLKANLISKAGNTYEYNGTKLGVGTGKVLSMLRSNHELREQIKRDLLNQSKSLTTGDFKMEDIINDQD